MIRQFGREQLLVLGLLILAFLIRLYCAVGSNVDLDEGQFVYDARLLNEGFTPFVDWVTRCPLLLSLIGASIKVFGYDLMAGKLVSIFFTVLTGYLLYRLGKELYSTRVGIIACALYLFMPFVIYSTIVTKEEPTQAFFVVLSMYMLTLGLRSGRSRFFFLNGLFIGVAFLVRRSSLAYLPLEPLFLLVFYRQLGVVVKKQSLILVGVLVGILPLVYIPVLTDWKWTNLMYGLGGDGGGHDSSGFGNAKVVFNTLVLAMPLILLTLSFILAEIRRRWAHVSARHNLAIASCFVLLFVTFLVFSFEEYGDSWNMIPLSAEFKIIAGILLGLGLVSIYRLISGGNLAESGARFSSHLLFYWLGSIVLFYIVFMEAWFANYFLELVPPLCIMSAVVLSSAYARFSERRRACQGAYFRLSFQLIVIFLIGCVIFSGVLLGAADQDSRSWSMHDIDEVGEYVSQHTSEGEEIFTMGTAFAVAADRPVVLHISHQSLYQGKEEYPLSYDPSGIMPKVSDIVSYLQENNVRYAVMDSRTKAMLEEHPELHEFVYSNYFCVVRFDKADIYVRHSD